tara:strand:- start:165 stop:815 length:651 start_codon:yes stop_codon:yes gene_type:complete
MDHDLLNYLQSFLTENRLDKFKAVLEERTRHFTLAVEDVGHLHNTSAVIRSCEAFGVQDVHVIEELHGKRIDREIAMGAQKWTDIHRYSSSSQAIASLKQKGYRIVATTPHLKQNTLEKFDISQPAAIFFGSEAKGLSQQVLDAADDYIYIPTSGFTQSLNISVSAAIILQRLTHRIKEAQINWELTEEERFDLELRWTKQNLNDVEKIVKRYKSN